MHVLAGQTMHFGLFPLNLVAGKLRISVNIEPHALCHPAL